MPIRNNDVFALVERISAHYQNNINNRFIRQALLVLKIPRMAWENLERLTGKIEDYKLQSYDYTATYEQIYAAAQFVQHARQEILPNLRSLLCGSAGRLAGSGGAEDKDRVLREMAVNNFSANLGILADLVNELYVKVVELDKAAHPKGAPVYTTMRELKEIGRLLV